MNTSQTFTFTVTATSLKVARMRRTLCVALAVAIAEHRADTVSKSDKGRKAMERVGAILLKRLSLKLKTAPAFTSIDTMLAYVNTAKQSATQALLTIGNGVLAFDVACERATVRKIHTDTVEACEEFQAEWKAELAPPVVEGKQVNG